MQFEFSAPTKIIFGSGRLESIFPLIEGFGNRVLVVSGANPAITNRLAALLKLNEIGHFIIPITGEPTIDSLDRVLNSARKLAVDMIIAIGGGSAIDTAKVAAALLTNPGDVSDYLEVIGLNKPLTNPSLPLIAIPTTSGTGSEATRNAVIGSPTHHVKVSMRSPHLLPSIALVDPELTLSLPPSLTATSGLDALTQLIEPFTCIVPNPLIDSLCEEGIRRIARSFYKAYVNGNDLTAREDMSCAALFSGLALANARLGAVHGLAGPISGEISAPHGAICAALLPHVMLANITALLERSPEHPSLARYAQIGRLLSGDSKASMNEGIQWVQAFCSHAHIKPLSTYGLTEDQFPGIIERANKASSMKGNPITLSEAELRNILKMTI